MKLSVCIITLNEEANIGCTLQSVQPLIADGQGEIIVVDSGSTDKTVEIAKSYGTQVFVEPWKGFAAQKNSAIDKAQGGWILSLDADEEVSPSLLPEITLAASGADAGHEADSLENVERLMAADESRDASVAGYYIPRKNFFLGRSILHGGFYPDLKIRLFKKGAGTFENRRVHEDVRVKGFTRALNNDLLHHAYPTLSSYIEHMNKYSSLGAEMEVEKGRRGFSLINIVIRPWLTFIYNYVFRLGFLDGKEGLLLHLYHAAYVSWKYAKVWELSLASKG